MAAVKASVGAPGELDITTYRNDSIDDFELSITHASGSLKGQAVDLSIYDEIVGQIKYDKESPTNLIEFSKDQGSILWSVDANGIETGDGTDGKIVLRKTMIDMESLPADKFVWDVQFIVTSLDKRNTLVYGKWTNEADVTR